jgi:uncharacterized protein Yka (UPF0111/DUF47 family)
VTNPDSSDEDLQSPVKKERRESLVKVEESESKESQRVSDASEVACSTFEKYDDGTNSKENLNRLRRHIAQLRNKISKLTVQFNDLKSKSNKEISKLRDKVKVEKRKRITI